MPRIRTVKPELFRHEELFEAEKFYQLPLRLGFIGLFGCCDREGRFRWRPRQLKLDIFPFDDLDMSLLLDALTTRGFIVKYECDDEVYGWVPSWSKHQCINHRESPSILPSLEDGMRIENTVSDSFSENIKPPAAPQLPQKNLTPRETQACLGMPGGNRKGKGREEEGNKEMELHVAHATRPSAQERSAEILAPVEIIFNHWKHIMNHPQALLDNKRRCLIQQALQKGYSCQQLCDAITGCSKTPYNMGENDQGQRYEGLHIILRDADQIDRFIHNCQSPPQPNTPTRKLLKQNLEAGHRWLMKRNSEDVVHGKH